MQSALTMGLTPNVCGYDPFEKGMEGAAEEMYHCAFPGARVTWTADIGEALDGADFVVSSGGAPRKEGMTREDLLKGNAEIAAQLGRDIKQYCPDLKMAVVIFNPADITGADHTRAFRPATVASRHTGRLGQHTSADCASPALQHPAG